MNCPRCDARLYVYHTYNVGFAKTQDAVCRECDEHYTLITKIERKAEDRGSGAWKLAQELRSQTNGNGA